MKTIAIATSLAVLALLSGSCAVRAAEAESRGISLSGEIRDKEDVREISATREAVRERLLVGRDPAISRDLRRQIIKSMSVRGGGPVERELERNFGDNIQDLFYSQVRSSDPVLADRTLDGITTYYLINMWQIANQQYNYWPPAKSVSAVREKVRAQLLQPGAVPEKAADLQREAESIMYAVITMSQAQKNALEDRSEKSFQLISDQAQAAMVKQGYDMRGLDFGESGFEPRPRTASASGKNKNE